MLSSLRRLPPRLLLAAAGFAVAAVPVTLLGYLATHGWGPLHSLDAGAATSLHDWAVRSPGAVTFLQDVSTVFHPWALRAVTVVAIGWLVWRRQIRLALWVGITMGVAGLLGDGLKTLVGRARPALPHPVATAPGDSFPSGHALNSFVFAAVAMLLIAPLLGRVGKAVGWSVAAVFVLLIGFARVGLGVHYVSDVVAGWLLGAGLVAVTAAAFESWRRSTGGQPRSPADEVAGGVDPAGSRQAARSPGTPARGATR